MASCGKVHQMFFLVIFVVACSINFFNVEARESVFFSKMKPVRRYSQLVSSSKPAIAPQTSVEITPSPAPAPALSDVESPSENYVYGFYNREVGEFPVATTETYAKKVEKISRGDELMNNDIRFSSQDENQRYNNYENEYTRNDRNVNQYRNFRRGYGSNNNVHNHKYTRSYDDSDNRYSTNNNYAEYNNDQYNTDKNKYYTDNFERVNPRENDERRFVDNGRYYRGDGYYRNNESANQYNPAEEYEGVYQP